MIERENYLRKLIDRRENGLIKVITGIRRSGKSTLLFEIFKNYLLSTGVKEEQIITLALDDDENIRYRHPLYLGEYLRSRMVDKTKMYYILLDEIQKVSSIKNPYLDDPKQSISFVDVLLGLMKKPNADVYVTGSNSKMLSSDILTEFRGRGDEIRVYPLSFLEFYSAYSSDKSSAFRDYSLYGGMPYLLSLKTHEAKSQYLTNLFENIYLNDILERYRIKEKYLLDDILDIVSSSIGSLTNPNKIAKTFNSVQNRKVSDDTISTYLNYMEDAFLLEKVKRFDIKGRKYIGSPYKYYYTDIGLRNARINFRQDEINHTMENLIYNELLLRGFSVDIGNIDYNFTQDGKNMKTKLEVDFVANKISQRYYIQSAFHIDDEEKRKQIIKPFKLIPDAFKRVVIVKDNIIPWHDDYGILYIGIEQFLLEHNALEL